MTLKEILGFAQGGYFLITGLWPIVHIESFVAVSGPKTDIWLVKTLGILITSVAIVLLVASFNKRITPEIALLGIGCALGLGIADVYYSLTDTISKAYLWDALAEAGFVVLWFIAWRRGFRK